MEFHRDIWGLMLGMVLVSTIMQNSLVEASKPCPVSLVDGCTCDTFKDCPLYGECLSGYCQCMNGDNRNGSHIKKCNQCTYDSRNCPPLATCINNVCECPFGQNIIETSTEKAVYVCLQCQGPQDCPAYAECNFGQCQCKHGVIAKNSKTGKVTQCDDGNIKPIVLIGIIVPIMALVIGLIAVATFYFFWRRQFRPFRSVEKSYFITVDKNSKQEEEGRDNPAGIDPTPVRYERDHVGFSPAYSDEIKIHPSPPLTSPPRLPESQPPPPPATPEPHQTKRTPQTTPEIHYKEPKVDSPVTPNTFYSSEDLSHVPVHHQSKGELRSSPANKRSNTDLHATPVHHPVKADFHKVPSEEPESEDDEPAIIPSQHEADVLHLTEAPLLNPSSTMV